MHHLPKPLLFAALTVLSLVAVAQDPAAPAAVKKLQVIGKAAAPFVFDNPGGPTGYSVDLWRRIALENGYDSEFTIVKTVPEIIDRLQARAADVGFGAISVTSDREAAVDFTHPFYESGLRILVNARGESSPFTAFRGLLKMDVFKVVGLLALALLINAHVLWWIERRLNPECFPKTYGSGVVEATWWSVSTLITGGCENKTPIGVVGRIVAVIWMLAGIGLVSYVTATLSATMTVNTLQSDVRSLDDLAGQPVGTIAGSSAERFLQGRGMQTRGFEALDSATAALEAGEVKAVIYDEPILRYYLSKANEHPVGKSLQLVGDLFDRQNYAFALQPGSPLRKQLNETLLKLGEQGFFEELRQKWFPERAP